MTLKAGKAARKQNAANARKKATYEHDNKKQERSIEELEDKYNGALQTIECLESKLADAQSQSVALDMALGNEMGKVSKL